MKIAAVVILYHPSEETISNIKSYYDCVDTIFVFDNSETKSVIQEELLKSSKIRLFHDSKNEGIAKRLNEACNLAIQQGFDWLLTMDQDTSFTKDSIFNYINCLKEYKGKEQVAMFGTAFSRRKHQPNKAGCTIVNAEKLITSGSVLNLQLFEKIGEFDEKLFIDAVDYDYCFRAKILGFLIIQFTNIFILHTVGNEVNRSSVKTLFLVRKKKEIHSPLRCYYMYRNMLYLNEKYKSYDPIYSKRIREFVLSRIKVSLLYGRSSIKILRYIKMAKADFKKNKMGKIDSAEGSKSTE